MNKSQFLSLILLFSAGFSFMETKANEEELSPMASPIGGISRSDSSVSALSASTRSPSFQAFRTRARVYNELLSNSKDKSLSKEERQEARQEAGELYERISKEFPKQLEEALKSGGVGSKSPDKKKPRSGKMFGPYEESID